VRTLSGIVTSGWDQEPIPGAHLILELNVDGEYYPLGDGTTTDANGFYSFTFVPGGLENERIKITHIAHEEKEVFPHLISGNSLDITMNVASHQQDMMTIPGSIVRNNYLVWIVAVVILCLIVLFYSEGTKQK
jgi:hypothetical protein